MSSMKEYQEYIKMQVNPILEGLITNILLERPEDPVSYMITWLEQVKTDGTFRNGAPVAMATDYAKLKSEVTRLNKYVAELESRLSGPALDVTDEEESSDDEMDSDEEETQIQYAKRGPRTSVSAEAYGEWNKMRDYVPVVHPKNSHQSSSIRARLMESFMFNSLEENALNTLIDAVELTVLEAGQSIIKEGDDGQHLYIIDSGELECSKMINGEEVIVKVCSAGDVFGELALLYNTPRAASVRARTKSELWSLDRETFNAVVKEAAAAKRLRYEAFVKQVRLLDEVEQYERSKIAEAFKVETYSQGDVIVKQGDPGDKFYVVEEGRCAALKCFSPGSEPQEVMKYEAGDYFGELALLHNEPRAASIVARGNCTVLYLDRRSFNRLLGPLDDILHRNKSRYA